MSAPAPAPIQKPCVRYAAIYVRVSTTDQGERYSPGSQKEKALSKASADGYTVLAEHIFVDMHTGKETARPALEKLRALVKTGTVQTVIVLCVDRLARKVHDAALLAAEFKRNGCALDFVEMRNDDSPEGRLQFNILASMAEYMGEKIVERGKDGRKRMVEDGRIPGGVPVYGHDAHPAEKGKRTLNEREAKVAREMFELYRDGSSCYAIASQFNARSIKSKNGKPWSRTTVRQLLTNRAYIGEHRAGEIVLSVPRIVSDELFFSVQAQLSKTAKQWVGRPGDKFLLRNFGFCALCGHRLIGKSKGAFQLAYRCGHRSNKPPIKQLCPALRVKAAVLEAVVWRAVWQLLTTPALLLSQAEAYYDSLPKPDTSHEDAKRVQLAKLRRQRDNRKKMYDAGDEEYTDEARAEMREIKRQIAALEAELNALAPVVNLPAEHVIASCLREIATGDEPETYARRRDILEGLPEFRASYADGEVELTGRVPLRDGALALPTSAARSPVGTLAVRSARGRLINAWDIQEQPQGQLDLSRESEASRRAESTISGGSNCYSRFSDDLNSPPSIPFKLKLRVA